MIKKKILKHLLKYHGEEKVSKALLYIDSAIDESLKQQKKEYHIRIRNMFLNNIDDGVYVVMRFNSDDIEAVINEDILYSKR